MLTCVSSLKTDSSKIKFSSWGTIILKVDTPKGYVLHLILGADHLIPGGGYGFFVKKDCSANF